MSLDLDPCRVFADSGELLAEGFVREHDDAGLLVEAEHFSGSWLHPGDDAVVEIKSAVRGEVTYDAVVVSSEARRILLDGLRLRAAVQKRAAVRVTTSLAYRVTHRVEAGEKVRLDEPLDVTVLDVSAHGLRLLHASEIEAGTRLALRFAETDPPLDLVLHVLRSTETRAGHAHGCRFERIEEREMDALFRYVLAEQRRQRALRMDTL